MLLRLKKGLSQPERESILLLCKDLGYSASFLDGARTLLVLEGLGRPSDRSRLGDLTGVLDVLESAGAPELHERGARRDSVLGVGDARFGGGAISIIAGPCAIEDLPRSLEIARAVRGAGATLLRGGAFKPRSSPYSFQGLGEAGLDILAAVKAETGIGIVTEVLDPRDVERVGQIADVFQIGARSMSNFALLKEVGATHTPVLLKRGFAATLREFLLAAEYVLSAGNEQVVLCERGIRSFDPTTRNVLDVGGVADLKATTHLPVIVDPSHAAGRAELVRPLARAGIAAGADGLLVEVHPAPDEVHSDGRQAVSTAVFAEIVDDTRKLAALDGRELVVPEIAACAEGTGGRRRLV